VPSFQSAATLGLTLNTKTSTNQTYNEANAIRVGREFGLEHGSSILLTSFYQVILSSFRRR